MISMYAIPNCDTVKKARQFLDKNKINYTFIDFKKCPPTEAEIKAWSDFLNELPINPRGTTYRKFKDTYDSLNLQEKIAFIIKNPSMIKRPILIENDKIIAIGFNEENYRSLFHDIE